MEPCHWLAELLRKTQVGGGINAVRGRRARDQIVLLLVSCVPLSRPTGRLGWVEGAQVTAGGVYCGWGGVTRGSCRTSGALENTSCVLGPLRACALPRPLFQRARKVCRALAQHAGARRPPARWPKDRVRDTDHVLAAGVLQRKMPAALSSPPAPLVLILSFSPPARASSNRYAAGVQRAPAARPCAVVTASLFSPSPPPAIKI